MSFLEKVRTKVYCCSLAEDRFPIHVPTLESSVREMLPTEAVFSVNSAGHKVLPVILGTRYTTAVAPSQVTAASWVLN